ncbi:radical SAM protein [Enterobacter asburiae]|uniref:radical SAM protein n=1 Tax=Enterobacter asburiae TaxID=61645 RepID=UPI0028790B99|nr:radical SAM protein [Enterobacter asburiae]MDS1916226.1 radical SAM protein [Enterobacter asburiae]
MEISEIIKSNDGSRKYLLTSQENKNKSIEATYFRYTDNKLPYLCISSQYGCAVGCVFCETGRQKPVGNMLDNEIFQQVKLCENDMRNSYVLSGSEKINTILFAGMGEPLLNINNVIKSIKSFRQHNISERISLTTVGIKKNAELLYDVKLDNICISMHATTDKQRDLLIPFKSKFNVKELLDFFCEYKNKTAIPAIKINYLLLDGINDSEEDLKRLLNLVDKDIFFVNLKYLNDVSVIPGIKIRPSNKFEIFYDILSKNNINCKIERSDGTDIFAGCGQLKSKVRDIKTKYKDAGIIKL